ncbi:polymeric immunoglobulin receptor-like protein [Labeo rohita]|nr:polymeric immunoglobulin receptor-like protein [Labeo rohita]
MMIFLCSVVVGALVTFNGHRGERFDIRCPYKSGYETNSKYLCKGECNIGNKNIMVESGSPAKDERFSLTDDTAARVFTVTIADLRTGDEGQYWCAVKRTLALSDIYSEILLQVKLDNKTTEVPAFSSFTATLSYFSTTEPNLQSTSITITGRKDTITDQDNSSTGVVSSISVTGYSGGGVIITCRYDRKYTAKAKYFCRGQKPNILQPKRCSDLIKTEVKEKWVDKGRFSLYDNTSAAVFTVTIRDLSEQDSGTYQCGVDISGQIDSYTEVNLTVISGSSLIIVVSVVLILLILGIVPCIVTFCKKHQARVKGIMTSNKVAQNSGHKDNITCTYDSTDKAKEKYVCKVQWSKCTVKEISGIFSLHNNTRTAVFNVSLKVLGNQNPEKCAVDYIEVDFFVNSGSSLIIGLSVAVVLIIIGLVSFTVIYRIKHKTHGVVSSISVTGYSGGGVVITCRYYEGYTGNAKCFCKGQWSECTDQIRTNTKNKWVDNGRFSLYDDTRAAVFTVTIRDLSERDSDTYYCGTERTGYDLYTEVNLKVSTADCCVKSISLSAAAGGSVNISCKYPQSHSADVKFVCRRSGSDLCAEETSVKENRRWSAEGQIQLYDDREQQLLTGTISHVTQQHSAEYWCGVQSDQGHKSFIT